MSGPHLTRVLARAITAIATVALVLTVMTACTQKLSPAAQTVQDLLELRSQNSTDTASYERYVESTGVASTLAEDSAARKAGKSPIPGWETPRVSKETSTGVQVTVKWVPSQEFKDWPESTVFLVAHRDDRWVIVDATEPSKQTSGTAPSQNVSDTGTR